MSPSLRRRQSIGWSVGHNLLEGLGVNFHAPIGALVSSFALNGYLLNETLDGGFVHQPFYQSINSSI